MKKLDANYLCDLVRQFVLQRHQGDVKYHRDADGVADFASLDARDGVSEGDARNLGLLGFLRTSSFSGSQC
jgi:hypothetical protein